VLSHAISTTWAVATVSTVLMSAAVERNRLAGRQPGRREVNGARASTVREPTGVIHVDGDRIDLMAGRDIHKREVLRARFPKTLELVSVKTTWGKLCRADRHAIGLERKFTALGRQVEDAVLPGSPGRPPLPVKFG